MHFIRNTRGNTIYLLDKTKHECDAKQVGEGVNHMLLCIFVKDKYTV